MAKRKPKEAPPTDAQLAEAATAAHEQQLAANPVNQPLPSDSVPLYPSTPPELLDAPGVSGTDPFDAAIAARQAGEFEHPHAEPAPKRVGPADPLASFKDRDWGKFADPAPLHAARFADGYEIALQESPSRHTVEIQFGDGSKAAQPQAFDRIKDVLRNAGLRWNARPGFPGNAWEIELRDERRGTHAEKLAARDVNKAIRTKIEEQVFPQVIALEEERRGPIELTDDFRSRIQRAVTGASRA